ncbi:hypothetical protein CFN79_11735 [Chromobacterium vaccinii]|uniref:Peptidase C80 domain-containing protein n=1 Tax=Pseudogulbenkiania ferrooxidans EGD-HP2 TaxID=1388764 RepID=A0ABN0NC45_9NEIS|nr:hypothetical protein CFN79_11735 [Chromobacterium vaccinii]ERE19483.1 hypothetical protein O166_20180 [Pseudogulbenkiania ferrooxidans EGD-HP2]
MPGPLGINGAQNALPIHAGQTVSAPQAGQATGAASSPLPGPSSQKAGALYAAFASEDIVQQALGKNLSRDTNGKQLYPLIARNDQDRGALEQWRKKETSDLTQRSQTFNQMIQNLQLSTGKSLNDIRTMLGPQNFDAAQAADKRFQQEANILARMDIRSNQNGQELAQLRPNDDKLYIIGHGGPGMNILAADQQCLQGKATAADVAGQLASGGLDKAFSDIRVTACYSADTRKPSSFAPQHLAQTAKPDTERNGFLGLFGPKTVKAEPFAQTLSNEMKKAGFSQPNVAGYHGAGVTFSTDHQQRRLPGTQQADIRSSDVRQRFTPTK